MNDDIDITEEPTDKSVKKKTVPSLLRNFISYIGLAIAVASFTSIVLLILISFSESTDNPYTDLITFIFVPSILGFGIFVTLVGVLWERHRRRNKSADEIAAYPILDLNDPRRRRSLLVFVSVGFIFLSMTAFGSYRAFEYTESVTFCGQMCHDVMKPEFIAHQASAHAKIRCVECHVGGGADAYVKAKFNGMNQLKGVITGHFNRPIETPVANMRSADATCQKCHWSEKFHGDKIKVFNHYGYGERSELNQTRLLVKVGGGDPNGGPVGGIHWHMNVNNEVTFISGDERRQTIPYIRMKDLNGNVVEYKARDSALTADEIATAPKRKMDCIDCHNRPAHIYLSPNQAVDRSLEAGKLDLELPFVKAKSVEVLAKPYTTNDEAVAAIAADFTAFYQTTYPAIYKAKTASIDGAVAELQRIYQIYFFPEMKTDWKASPNNIGHLNAQGCFRCHDGQHFSNDGKVIRNECSVCHTTIDQTFGGKTYTPPDGKFSHPVKLGDRNTFQCASCHQGDRTFVHPINLGDISQFACAECHKGPKSTTMNF